MLLLRNVNWSDGCICTGLLLFGTLLCKVEATALPFGSMVVLTLPSAIDFKALPLIASIRVCILLWL